MAKNLINDETFELVEGMTKEELQTALGEISAIKTALQSATKRTVTQLWSGDALADGTIITLSDDPTNYDEIRIHYAIGGYRAFQYFSPGQLNSTEGANIITSRFNVSTEADEMEINFYRLQLIAVGGDDNEYMLNSGRWQWSGVASESGNLVSLPAASALNGIRLIYGIKYEPILSE